jgi:hypothetical protein
MTLLTADRGQALQVGAVLLFGILVILFTVWQAFVIPDQNERVEFSHSQEVQSEMVELRGDVVSTADATTPTSGSVKLGAQFPTRLLFVNPTPAAGVLRTESLGDEEFIVENANATAQKSGEALYWNGTNRTYETTSLEYSPDYRVFQGAPETLYDNTVTYNFFERDQNTSALSEQTVIDGDTITLISLVGDYSESGIGSVTPDITPVSTRAQSVSIENDTSGSGGNITLHLPTRLNASQWEQLLDGEDNVLNVSSPDSEMVQIELEPGQYELRMAKIGVGEGLAETRPAYIEPIEGAGEKISRTQNHTITVEVRDRFNVPQNSVNITASVNESKGEIRPATKQTNVDGQATFSYNPDASNLSANETVSLNFEETFDGTFVDDQLDNTTVNVTIGGDASAGELIDLRWTRAPGSCSSDEEAGEDVYYEDCDFGNRNQAGGTYTINATTGNASGIEVQLTHTNDTLANIVEKGTNNPKPRAEFTENGGEFTVDIDLDLSGINPPPGPGSRSAETTLIATVDGETETLFIDIN